MTELSEQVFDPLSIAIEVITTYLPRHSNPEADHYTFAYTITIKNQGSESVQLLSRYWRITDADEQVQEVRGEGVVGEQPVIEPGASFRYTSGTNLETPVGFMEGAYYFILSDSPHSGEQEVPIPPFSLYVPGALH